MSVYVNRATASLLNMSNEMLRKGIEISRITKTCALLLMSGMSRDFINPIILEKCLTTQHKDGGFIGNTDTLWNIKLLEYFPEFHTKKDAALRWLITNNGTEEGLGRSKRDVHRITQTGLALYLLPEIATSEMLTWLENSWISEKNSLTYKAAYTLLAFHQCHYNPHYASLIRETEDWLISQQQLSGGFAPWHNHPVGENVYCTAIAMLGLLTVGEKARDAVKKARSYLCSTQLKNGIWPYHEIEDGTAWGLYALTESYLFLDGTK